MPLKDRGYNQILREFMEHDENAQDIFFRLFFRMPAVQQMLMFFYQVCRKKVIQRNEVYVQFFQTPFVKQFCDQEGIEKTTIEASKRRCPFLLNILDACNIIKATQSRIFVNKLVLAAWSVRLHPKEDEAKSQARLSAVEKAYSDSHFELSNEDLSVVREIYGTQFMTEDYHLKDFIILRD